MKAEEAKTDLGVIRIHKKVIASIAALAAMETEGIKTIGGNLKSSFYELIGKKGQSSITVEIDKNNEVRLEIPLVIKYGFNLPEVASKAQENVQRALDKMTNLNIKDIDINIQGVEREH
jgi:uncharacterized alkaline shock family protein YloU